MHRLAGLDRYLQVINPHITSHRCCVPPPPNLGREPAANAFCNWYSVMLHRAGCVLSDGEADEEFGKMDADGGGFVLFNEFCTW